jgi:hypothetical protein
MFSYVQKYQVLSLPMDYNNKFLGQIVKRTHLTLKACIVLALLAAIQVQCAWSAGSAEGIKLGVFVGGSVPDADVGNVYRALITDGVEQSYSAARSLGTHFGAKVRVGLSESFSLQGTASVNFFRNQEQRVVIAGVQVPTFLTSSSYIPVTAGAVWFPINTLVRVGVSGEMVYTYRSVGLSSSTDELKPYNININNIDYNRNDVGAALGVSIGLDVLGIQPHIEVKKIWSNQFVRRSGEAELAFMQVSLGILL